MTLSHPSVASCYNWEGMTSSVMGRLIVKTQLNQPPVTNIELVPCLARCASVSLLAFQNPPCHMVEWKGREGKEKNMYYAFDCTPDLGWVIGILYSIFILMRTFEMFYFFYFENKGTEAQRG